MKTLINAIFLFAILFAPADLRAQAANKVKVTGTGNTTGHIANLTVTNSGSSPLLVQQQTVYIPSDGRYQPYVATVPETNIPPKGTTVIPIDGYCSDVHTPPVPSGTDMPSIDSWIPVGNTDQPVPEGSINIIPEKPLPPFEPEDIPGITTSPGFKPFPQVSGADIIINWPGTDIPVGGVMNPNEFPKIFAPVIVKVLEVIEEGADVILSGGNITTPFSGQPEKEREAVIQQTFWIYMSAATGDEYTREHFSDKVYDQFQTTTGKPVSSLPQEQKKEVDSGIDNFWSTFTAVGIEAKVLTAKAPASSNESNKNADKPNASSSDQVVKVACACDSLTFTVNKFFGGREIKVIDVTIKEFGGGTAEQVLIELEEDEFFNETKIKVSNIKLACKPCGAIPCEYYRRERDEDTDEMAEERKNKVRISGIKLGDPPAAEKVGKEEVGDNSLEITVIPKKTSANYYLKFRIGATCMAPDCPKAVCFKDVEIQVKLLTKKVKDEREKAAAKEKKKKEKASKSKN